MPSERETWRRFFEKHPEAIEPFMQLRRDRELRPIGDEDPANPLSLVCGYEHQNITGAKLVRCADCGEGIWLSPTSQREMHKRQNPKDRTICPRCFMKETREESE
jgi:hypothetical protein